MSGFQSLVSSPLFGILLAPVVKFGVDKLKSVSKKLDAASPLVKQTVAVATSLVGVVAVHLASGLNPDLMGALTSAFTDGSTAAAVGIASLGAIAVKHGEQNYVQSQATSIFSSSGASELK